MAIKWDIPNTPSRWTAAYLDQMTGTGDALADHTIEVIEREHGIDEIDPILGTLIQNDQLLPEQFAHLTPAAAKALRDYLVESSKVPPWADQARILVGEQLYMDHGMIGFSLLGCASLPEAYATGYAATVLGTTQVLETHVRRRIYESMQFVVDMMTTGGLTPGGKGIRSAQKVRLMHASIRRLILSDPKTAPKTAPATLGQTLRQVSWPPALGKPIHQVSKAMAALSFSYVVLRGLKTLGIAVTPAEESGFLHAWNVVAHIMGVNEELLLSRPETMAEAEELYNIVWPPSIEETDEGKKMEEALLKYLEGLIPAPMFPLRHVPRMLTRELIGDRMSKVLGVTLTDAEERALIPLVKGISGVYHIQDEDFSLLPSTRKAAEWFFRLMAKGVLNMQRGGDRHPFKIPQYLANQWQLDK
jgi:hypothetical protein